MLEQAYQMLMIGAIIILAVLIFSCFIRAIMGPRIVDRIVAIIMIGTMTMMIIAILSIYLGESYLVDVCLIYAMISFLAVIVLTKVYTGVHNEKLQKQKIRETENINKIK